MMNYKMQLSPISSTHKSHIRLPRARWEEARFFRSWLVYDSDLEATRTRGRINWNMVTSLALITLVSGGGWVGISLLLRHLLK